MSGYDADLEMNDARKAWKLLHISSSFIISNLSLQRTTLFGLEEMIWLRKKINNRKMALLN